MDNQEEKFDPYLMQLILSLQAGAMQQLGKIISPVSGKIERDMELARFTIDMLGMLQTKTMGNLTDEESHLLARVLSELRLNYVDESKKDQSPTEKKTAPKPGKSDDSSPAAEDGSSGEAD